jgi:tetratricopeptide (TPR) repeat protein
MDPDEERRLAADLFNQVWKLLELQERSRAQDDEMLHAAHASRHHWGQVGEATNLARGEWQCSRVYSVLGRSEPALHHAHRCLEICQENDIGDFDLAFAHEALARAYGVGGDSERAKSHAQLALSASEQISEDDDRELLLQDLATLD